ncbi:hypothetical protein C0J52_04647 [Blattella germanica]|nr:hypothetical protein C0J52_04647 [Blattella germanica]
MKEYFVCVYILFIVEVLYLTDAGGEFLWRMKREANITEIKCCMQEGIPTGKRGLRDSIEMRDIGKICFEEIQNKSSDAECENHRVKLKNKYGEPQKDVSKTDGE